MSDTTETQLLALNHPGIVIEVDVRIAEDLGAFEEDALTEEEALASVDPNDLAGTH